MNQKIKPKNLPYPNHYSVLHNAPYHKEIKKQEA